MRFPAFLAPIAWSFAAGYTLEPLARALGTPRADLVASALQTVSFFGLCTAVLWVEGIRARGQAGEDLTTRDWSEKRRELIAEEKETARQYQALLRPGNLALGCANGLHQTKVFYFPAGITLAHLTAFGDLVAAGKPPRYRNLKATFDHQLWSDFRDWLLVAELNKFAVMAEYTNGREEWDVNACGRKLAIMWRCQVSPTGLMSSAKKCMIRGNEMKNKQSKQTIGVMRNYEKV